MANVEIFWFDFAFLFVLHGHFIFFFIRRYIFACACMLLLYTMFMLLHFSILEGFFSFSIVFHTTFKAWLASKLNKPAFYGLN